MGALIQFPRVRDRRFVMKQVAKMASAGTVAHAERHLSNALGIQAAAMAKRGFAPEVIKAELAAIECAIRAELWRAVLTPGGAA